MSVNVLRRLALALGLSIAFLVSPAHAEPDALPQQFLDALAPRPLGPGNMSGRVTAVAVVKNRPATMYVAAASGGVWKTVNNGVTWAPVFDDQPVAAIGDVAVSASNPDVVWVGTGEANARNSVSRGDGVYKSTDGGKTWRNMGLRDSFHVARVIIHPTNPNIVYVAALGHVFGPNLQRGLFRTDDGGKTWQESLVLNEDAGVIDLQMDPGDPEILYAAAYGMRRDRFAGGNPARQFSADAGLYKTTDGGKKWTRMTNGLPTRPLGRCGLSVYPKDPRIIYAVVSTDKTSTLHMPGQPPKTDDQPETGGVFRSADKGETWVKVNDLCPRPFYFGQIRVDPNDDRRVYVGGTVLFASADGGKTFRNDIAAGVHNDDHALWIDPADSDHLVLGTDGGLYFSYDRGGRWQHLLNLPIDQFYAVGVDMRKPYRVYGGLQDNGSWGGPSRTLSADGVTVADWFRIYGADGFYCQPDPNDADTVYCEGQYGMLQRVNVRLGLDVEIAPRPPTKQTPAYRFNWNSPILISPHNSQTIYYGGNFVFKSVNRGDTWQAISPDVTYGQPGPSEDHGHTISTLAESPLRAGVLWAGTDDGRVLVTRDGGVKWHDVSARLPGPAERWVSRVECSPFAEGTAFVAVDRHRYDDISPYLFKTEDFGATWKALSDRLPAGGHVHVVRADPRNRDLLFVGTEFGLSISIDGGATWTSVRKGLPPVAVHDLVLHPRERELVIATHGRGLFVMDVAPLEQIHARTPGEALHLFDVKPAAAFTYRRGAGLDPNVNYTAPNPPYGTAIFYYLKDRSPETVRIQIVDARGSAVANLKGSGEAGLHGVQWSLQSKAAGADDGGTVAAGEYVIHVKAGDQTETEKVRVETEE
jgi:photosystem II stability/assembly factor-like uncharacterized protein